jgi:hypothetical protein
MATWRKTKQGDWVVYATFTELDKAKFETGAITVTSKSGATKTVGIESIGKSFIVDGVEMAYGYPMAETRATTRRNGSPAPAGTCDNCGGRGAKYERVDSSGIGGIVCGVCSREDRYSLSFC